MCIIGSPWKRRMRRPAGERRSLLVAAFVVELKTSGRDAIPDDAVQAADGS
jgi:hypothetical protein